VAAVNFAAGAVRLGEAAFGTLIGPGFLDHFVDLVADDLPVNIRGLRSFLRACVARPVAAEDFETALCWNMAVRFNAELAALTRRVSG
jgi:non-heme chloroperoxidase